MSEKLELYKEVALTRDVAEKHLQKGDVAILINYVKSRDGEQGGILEVFNAVGESIAVVAVPLSALGALREDQVPAVRQLQTEQ